jgi:hypothetical protein
MCPLCITAGTLYLASVSAGSAGGLAAVAAKVMRGRKGRKGAPPMDNEAGSVAPSGLILRSRRR